MVKNRWDAATKREGSKGISAKRPSFPVAYYYSNALATSSDALVTSSDAQVPCSNALVTSSFLFLLRRTNCLVHGPMGRRNELANCQDLRGQAGGGRISV